MPDVSFTAAVRPHPQVGGRQAAAAARAAPVLSAPLRPLHRAVPRQRRRFPRSAQRGPARRPRGRLSDINADVIGCYRAVRERRRRSIGALAAARGRPPRGRPAHFYEVRDGRFNRRGAQIRPPRNPAGGLHAGARGDADLPQSHRLQRPVPRELARRVQRAGRPLRQSEDLRRRRTSAPGARRCGDPRVSLECQPFDEALADAAARRISSTRSAVRAAERDGAVHVLHAGGFDRVTAGRCSAR